MIKLLQLTIETNAKTVQVDTPLTREQISEIQTCFAVMLIGKYYWTIGVPISGFDSEYSINIIDTLTAPLSPVNPQQTTLFQITLTVNW